MTMGISGGFRPLCSGFSDKAGEGWPGFGIHEPREHWETRAGEDLETDLRSFLAPIV
jgi:hypothetical protein